MYYPECEKMKKVHTESEAIGSFLDWLSEKGVWLACQEDEDIEKPFPYQTEELLAEFFDIDLKKVEREKRHMLEGCRINNEASENPQEPRS